MNDWLNTNINQVHLTPDPPNGIDGQCVNAASSWSIFQGGPELRGATAYEIYEFFRDPFYEVISIGNGRPKRGDIVFFFPNTPITGSAGHVDICTQDGTDSGYAGVDTNWNNNPKLQYINHSYQSVVGMFRKVNQGGNVPSLATQQEVVSVFQQYTGRTPNQKEINAWVGQDLTKFIDTNIQSPETAAYNKKVQDALAGGEYEVATVYVKKEK